MSRKKTSAVRRLGQLIGKIFGVGGRDDAANNRSNNAAPPPPRPPTEHEIDEAGRASFPASDPPALALEEQEKRQ
jgi:hypothetical protein